MKLGTEAITEAFVVSLMSDSETLERRVDLIEEKILGTEPRNTDESPSLIRRVERLERVVHGTGDGDGLSARLDEFEAELDVLRQRLDEVEDRDDISP